MTPPIRLDVIGLPAPQGSKVRMPNGAMVDGTSKTGRARLIEWRRAVADAARLWLTEHPDLRWRFSVNRALFGRGGEGRRHLRFCGRCYGMARCFDADRHSAWRSARECARRRWRRDL